MKMISLSFSILGASSIVMAVLTALKIAPAFVGETMITGATASTTAFWGGLAILLLLAGIAFGVISGGRFES